MAVFIMISGLGNKRKYVYWQKRFKKKDLNCLFRYRKLTNQEFNSNVELQII